jgi:hypothetical protein
MNETLHRNWPSAFLAVLGLLYLWIGVVANGWDCLFAFIGGVLIIAAAETIRRTGTLALGILLLGSLPLAAATWWSIVTPVLAILTMLMGLLALRRTRAPRSDTAPPAVTG